MKTILMSLCLVAGLTGCNARTTTPAAPKAPASAVDKKPVADPIAEKKSATEPADKKAPEQRKVDLRVVNVGDVKKAIEAEKGKIVVLDLWATWCVPCMKEFPHLVELHHKHQTDNVVCMSLSLDGTDGKDKALKFLKQKEATFTNFLLQGSVTDASAAAQKEWDFTPIPVVLVFDRTGKLARKFEGDADTQFDYPKDVVPFVETLLKK